MLLPPRASAATGSASQRGRRAARRPGGAMSPKRAELGGLGGKGEVSFKGRFGIEDWDSQNHTEKSQNLP